MASWFLDPDHCLVGNYANTPWVWVLVIIQAAMKDYSGYIRVKSIILMMDGGNASILALPASRSFLSDSGDDTIRETG